MPSLNTAFEHLRYDIAHGFIELIPDESDPPFVVRKGLQSSDRIRLLVVGNPKRKNSKAHQAFALYRDGMTVDEFVQACSTVSLLKALEERPGRAGPSTSRRRALLPGIDPHGYWARRVREIIRAHVFDLGGVDAISAAERSILRRVSVLTVEAERLERRFASYARDHVARNDLDLYIRISNSLRHLLDLTGLERRNPKTLTPTIEQYIAEHSNDEPETTVYVPDPDTFFRREAAE